MRILMPVDANTFRQEAFSEEARCKSEALWTTA